MTRKPSRPASPPPEIVDQALALLFTAMEQGEPDDESEYRESKITHLDCLAWRHQVAGDALRVAAEKRAALLRRQRNALIPINQLPSELLSAILIKSADDGPPDRTKSLQMLARVAWQWWQTIKSDPQFWTHITPPMEGVELQIRKAGILPLRLSWTDYGDGTDYCQYCDGTDDGDGTNDEDGTDWDALGDLVQRHATRWIGIELKHFSGKEAGLRALCTTSFPRLKYLRVHLSKKPLGMSENWRFNLAQCQNLQEARLPIMPYLPTTPSLSPPIRLRTLHLDLRSADLYSSEDLESLLRLTPQLVELKVKNLLDDTSPPAPFGGPSIDLPNLLCLEFTYAVTEDGRECIPLLAQIRAPQLENLSIQNGRQAIFSVLAAWPSASTNRLEDAPLHSTLRNVGPSAVWGVDCSPYYITVRAEGSGQGRLGITLERRYPTRDQLSEHILTHIAPFRLPVNLNLSFWANETVEPEFWDEVLDATPSLRTFSLVSTVETARQVMDRLATKAPSSSSASPRAPHLEKLSFQWKDGSGGLWSEGDEGEAVKTMLDKRRDAFIQGGILDPPKLVVTGPRGLLFDEAGSRWLDSVLSDSERGS